MKKIIAFLILLLCVKQSYAQYPLKQYLGSDSTLVTVRGGMNARLVLWSFTDTTQANTQRINQYAGALIYTTGTDKVWYRNSTATGWIEFTSSGGTTTNIYNSDGFITGTRVLDLSASPLTFSRSGVKQFAAEDNLTTIGSPNNQKRITVYNDSITILGLSQTTDTTTYKPLAIDGNGYFTIMDRWPGGGGSTPTLFGIDDSTSTVDRYVNFKNHRFVLDSIFTAGSGYISGIYTGKASTSTSFRQTTYDSEAYLAFPRDEYKWVQLGSEAAGTDGDGAYFRDSYFKSYNSNATINAYASNYQGLFNSSIEINHNGINLFPDRGVLFIDSLLTSSSNSDEVVMWRAGDYGSIRRMPISTFLSFYTPPASWLQSGSVAGSLGTTFIGATDVNPLLFKIGGMSAGILGGAGNTAFGLGTNNADSLSNAGTYNTAMGLRSLFRNIGTYNTAIGSYSMFYNTTGSQNVALGSNSLYNNITGQKNSAFGSGALENNTSGDDNTAVGQDALLANTTGIRNIGIGWNGFANNFTGVQNIGIGYGAGKTITNGNNNTILGAFAAWDAAQNDTITGAVIIGHSATASEDSTVVLGNDYIKKTHLKGVVYAPFTAGSATTSDSALAVNRTTGALEMRPVAGGGTYTFTNGLTNSSGTVKLGGDLVNSTSINGKGSYSVTLDSLTGFTVKSPGLTKILTTSTQAYIYGNSSSTYMGVGTELFLAQQKSGNSISMSSDSFVLKMGGNSQLIIRPDSLNINPPLGIAIIDTLAAASNMTNKRVMTWDTVTKRWEQISTDSVGKKFGVEDNYFPADRLVNLNNNKLDLDSGSLHVRRKITSPRSDDIFSVGIGGNKSLYVTQTGDVYATQLYAGSGSFYTLGGLIAMNSSVIRLNGTSTFNGFQKKFQFIKEWPALDDSIGFEVKNDTSGISTLADTWANTYKILSLKYRSGVDNSLNNRYDFFGNGQPRFYMFGDSSFLDTPATIAGFDADGNMIEVLPSSLGGGGADGNNYPTSVGYTQSSRTLTIVRNGLADITTTLPEATTSLAGLLAGADKSFLDSLRAGQIIDTSYYGLISGPSNHDSAFVYWIPYSESNVDSSFMFLVPKYSGTVSSGTQYRIGYYAATGATISQAAAITASRALVSDANGVPTHATTTATELGYVSGVTSAIQTQIDGKISASSTNTLTNKRWTARVGSTTSSATPTINTDNYDIYKLTAQTADITSFTTNLTGTPNDGDILEIQITGTASRALTFGASFVSTTVTIPATTSGTTTLTVIFQYYTTSSYGNNKWNCVNYY